MALQRYYSSVAQAMTLVAGVNSSATSLSLNSVAGLPGYTPFTLVIDRGTTGEEIVTVTAVAGSSVTVIRGEDGSAAQLHTTGAAVHHMMTARDLREPQAHMISAADVHGVGPGSVVVGTNTAQTLTAKVLSGTANTFSGIPIASVASLPATITALQNADSTEATARGTAVGILQTNIGYAMPVGTIVMYAGIPSTPPGGWIICTGAAVSRTGQAALFAAIGTTYGAGDGSTTFNVPNFQGRVPVGVYGGDTEFNALGKTGGEKTHTLTIAEMPSHQHNDPTGVNAVQVSAGWEVAPGSGTGIANYDYGVQSAPTSPTGGGGAHNNIQPYISINFIIRAN